MRRFVCCVLLCEADGIQHLGGGAAGVLMFADFGVLLGIYLGGDGYRRARKINTPPWTDLQADFLDIGESVNAE